MSKVPRDPGRSVPLPVEVIRAHPTVTNPHIRMCAVITRVIREHGPLGEKVVREAYRALGHRTGQYMIATGVVPAAADLETYGRVSEQIMDACGLDGWTRVQLDPKQHRTIVPNCAKYIPQYERMGAPREFCSIPFEWDNGCLDVINPALRIQPERCTYAGDAECHYVIRDTVAATASSTPSRPAEAGAATDLTDAPAWTNPQAGLLTLISRSIEAFSNKIVPDMQDAMAALGVETGEYLVRAGVLRRGAAMQDIAAVAGAIEQVSGCSKITVRYFPDGARLTVDGNPYRPVVEAFGHAPLVSAVRQQWEDSWVRAVNPNASVRVELDELSTGQGDRRVFVEA